MTSALNTSQNDTGRTAYCGPTIVSAITGAAISTVEARIWHNRDTPERAAAKRTVVGTYDHEVQEALATFGYDMALVEDFMQRPRKERPTLWAWMQKPRNAWVHYVLAIHKGKEGHWIAVKGVMHCDTFTGGAWKFVVDGPHRGARLMSIYVVRKSLAAA